LHLNGVNMCYLECWSGLRLGILPLNTVTNKLTTLEKELLRTII
jgi:hypothetical protein